MALLAAVTATSRVRSSTRSRVLLGRQLAGRRVELRPPHRRAGRLGRLHPRPHVRVVVEPGHHDLVAGAQAWASVRATM